MGHFRAYDEGDLAARTARPAGTPDEDAPLPAGTAVWLSEWQLSEIGLDVGVGDEVSWTLVPADAAWTGRLFGERRTIERQLDLYAGLPGERSDWSEVAGCVVGVEVVRCPRELSHEPGEGWMPVPGRAWTTRVDRTGQLRGVVDPAVCGFIAHVRGSSSPPQAE